MAKNKKVVPIKQLPNSENCLACVMAMATNTTLKEVELLIGKKSSYSDKDLITYLLYHGYYLGCGFLNDQTLLKNSTLTTSFSLKNNPAYIIVDSQLAHSKYHAIYWNGHRIYDPNPYNKNGLPLSYYSIVEVYPIREFLLVSSNLPLQFEGIQP